MLFFTIFFDWLARGLPEQPDARCMLKLDTNLLLPGWAEVGTVASLQHASALFRECHLPFGLSVPQPSPAKRSARLAGWVWEVRGLNGLVWRREVRGWAGHVWPMLSLASRNEGFGQEK